MKIIPLTLAAANAHVSEFHRHHKPTIGHRFSLGLEEDGALIGVAICGRPVARRTDQNLVLEVLRLCTNGAANACSALYGACARVAKEMGFERIQTFTLATEPGTSLKATGWKHVGNTPGAAWSSKPTRGERAYSHPVGEKLKWVREL